MLEGAVARDPGDAPVWVAPGLTLQAVPPLRN
jgi:hypothetical protein